MGAVPVETFWITYNRTGQSFFCIYGSQGRFGKKASATCLKKREPAHFQLLLFIPRAPTNGLGPSNFIEDFFG